jgi:hypothetical protein
MSRSKLDKDLTDLVSGRKYHEDLEDIVAAVKQAVIDVLPEEHPDSWQDNQPKIEYELGRRQYRKEVLQLLEPLKGKEKQ